MEMLMKYFAFSLLLLISFYYAKAAQADTVLTRSASMQKEIKAVVILPDNYSKSNHYPVVYLLHGYSGNYADWITKVPAIASYSDVYHIIIVCADGDYNSWYFDVRQIAQSVMKPIFQKSWLTGQICITAPSHRRKAEPLRV